jgi:Fe-S cluster assembly iron-binding protein IscA
MPLISSFVLRVAVQQGGERYPSYQVHFQADFRALGERTSMMIGPSLITTHIDSASLHFLNDTSDSASLHFLNDTIDSASLHFLTSFISDSRTEHDYPAR